MDVNQAKYDISPLFKKSGFWRVQNYSAGALMMNVCGQMDTRLFAVDVNNDCTSMFQLATKTLFSIITIAGMDAQLCQVNGNSYESKGSLYSDLVQENEHLSLTLTGNYEQFCVLCVTYTLF